MMVQVTLRDSGINGPQAGRHIFALNTLRDARTSEEHSVSPDIFLERYRLITHLQIGADADLFLAERLSDTIRVVVKIYHPSTNPDPRVIERVSACGIQQLPGIYEHGESEGSYYEVIEYYESGSLRHRIGAGRPMHALVCRAVLQDVMAALMEIHRPDERGRYIVHRDIKPENILIRATQPFLLVLSDFSISQVIDEPILRNAPRDFTPRYVAPECLGGDVSSKCDYWSLGMALLEALTGTHPFDGLGDQEVLSRLAGGWRADVAGVPDQAWRTLIAGLLERDPALRWGAEQITNWLAVEQGESATSASASTGAASPEFLKSVPINSAFDLARALANQWAVAATLVRGDEADPWLIAQIERFSTGIQTAEITADRSAGADLRLLRLIHRLAPDIPPIWKSWAVSPSDISVSCRLAMEGDTSAQRDLEEIYDLDVLGEIGRLNPDRRELTERSRVWHSAVADFDQSWEVISSHDFPLRKPSRAEALPTLYRAACEDVPLPVVPAQPIAEFCCNWLAELSPPDVLQSTGHKLAKYYVSLKLNELYGGNMRTSFSFNPGEMIETHRAMSKGSDAPVVVFSGRHTAIQFRICDSDAEVGKRVRLSWNVSGASWIYLTGFGRVEPVGEQEFSLGKSDRFTLIAIGRHGITVYRTNVISVERAILNRHGWSISDLQPKQRLASHNWRLSDLAPLQSLACRRWSASDIHPRQALAFRNWSAADLQPKQSLVRREHDLGDLQPVHRQGRGDL